jgi:hypothetical protein
MPFCYSYWYWFAGCNNAKRFNLKITMTEDPLCGSWWRRRACRTCAAGRRPRPWRSRYTPCKMEAAGGKQKKWPSGFFQNFFILDGIICLIFIQKFVKLIILMGSEAMLVSSFWLKWFFDPFIALIFSSLWSEKTTLKMVLFMVKVKQVLFEKHECELDFGIDFSRLS